VIDLAPDLLREGSLTVEGRLASASNATLLCRLGAADRDVEGGVRCIYKPVAGERPLWDFPDGTLAGREVAAYLVSEVAGWHVVPPTVLRDGPFGPGMCQLWVEEDCTGLVDVVGREAVPDGWLRVLDARGASGEPVTLVHADDQRLRRMALFDIVINNADRKGGHVLIEADGTVLGIDHGVCFHVEPKLRTVLWGWSGEAVTDAERETLNLLGRALQGDLGHRLASLLTDDEVAATVSRVEALLTDGMFPVPVGDRMPIPWPPF
jgi:uncharacterized repeat protein (TIGR03843 family)